MHGYGGRIIYVNLTTKEIIREDIPENQFHKFLGGVGFIAKILYEELEPNIGAFDPRNVLIMGSGVFTGTIVPTAGKTIFGGKSPLTGGWGESVMGGSIGAELKHAGYDALVITGKTEKPSYIFINNDDLEFRSANDYWGKTTRETSMGIKKELGDPRVKVASIGIGGEKLVRYACIDCEDRQAGRSGLGAVMGSKNLKAIALRGNKSITIFDSEKLMGLSKDWYAKMVSSVSYENFTKYGTGEFLDWMNQERGTFPTRNWQESVFEEREHIDPYHWAPKYGKKNKACYACVKPCGRYFHIKEGRYAGTELDGVEYETLYSLGSQCGNSDIEALAKANELCDLLGIDTISAGVAIGFAMELYERGIITDEDTEGLELKFGNNDIVPVMVEKIAKREGVGDILAEGVKRAAEDIGKGAEYYAIHVKGQEPPAYDVRGLKGLGLGFMTSPRGACHLRSGAYAVELKGKFWKFEGVDRFSAKGKGEIVKSMEDLMTVYDCLGVCKFSRTFFNPQDFCELLEAVTGWRLTEADLLKIGERINNLKRMFNIGEGILIDDFRLPERLINEPIPEGVSKGAVISEREMNDMVYDYLVARGWDLDGVPSWEKLVELELEEGP